MKSTHFSFRRRRSWKCPYKLLPQPTQTRHHVALRRVWCGGVEDTRKIQKNIPVVALPPVTHPISLCLPPDQLRRVIMSPSSECGDGVEDIRKIFFLAFSPPWWRLQRVRSSLYHPASYPGHWGGGEGGGDYLLPFRVEEASVCQCIRAAGSRIFELYV